MGNTVNSLRLPYPWEDFYIKDVSFANLMLRRICHILIVANPYDAFMLEDDGRIDDKVFEEYMSLGLRYPPTFMQASTVQEAKKVLETTDIDLLICMPGGDIDDAFSIARTIKSISHNIPCVMLTPFSCEVTKHIYNKDLTIFDYEFCWLGNTNLLLSIIKLLEDSMNVEHDVNEVGTQVILLVEDNIRFYSYILPDLYSYILKQSYRFGTEALNPSAAAQRKRGRPKVILARNYEEAINYYNKYSDNILGVISDARFPIKQGNNEEADPNAGIKLFKEIRKKDEYVPLIMQSAEQENALQAREAGFLFVDKNSKTMTLDLRNIMEEHMGFGDFIFRDPITRAEVVRVGTLKQLQDNIFKIPRASMLYHVSRNHVSRWLSARAIFPISAFLKHVTWHRLQDIDAHRKIIFEAIVQYRRLKNLGVVADFDRGKFDAYAHFARIGEGSLGGKGRGLAFLDNIIKHNKELSHVEKANVKIPKTVVLCTDFFDEFIERNNLYNIALDDKITDEEILTNFINAQLPDALTLDFLTFIDAVKAPIAVRSSSLLEDAHYQPFAGVYSTYMVPWTENQKEMAEMIAFAVKGVYASVFFSSSKAYLKATSNAIDQEKMAVVLQEVVGKRYENIFYPTFSGVLRSINHYPIGEEKPEQGVANLALGLGKYIVDGGVTLRVCPHHPAHILQTSEVEIALRDTQTRFYALDLEQKGVVKKDDGYNICNLRIKQAEQHGTLKYIASTYDSQDNILRDGIYEGKRKVITFANVLQHGVFPLPELLCATQKMGVDAMGRPVEIEFACNLEDDGTGDFYLLQIRPIADIRFSNEEKIEEILPEKMLILSHNALGNGSIKDVYDVIYVKAGNDFCASDNLYIARELEKMNALMLDNKQGYVLIGPGRWGSSDPWLGIPVKWPHINAARVIVETDIKGHNVEPSQGTHFFQNLTSLGVGYFTIIVTAKCIDNNNPGIIVSDSSTDILRMDMLDNAEIVEETAYLRHIRFKDPLKITIDGKKQVGVIALSE